MLGIERGTGLIVGELGEGLLSFVAVRENPGRGISGEVGRQASDCFSCTRRHAGSTFRFVCLQLSESLAQSHCIELTNRKHADAALRTSWAADQPLAAASRSIRQRCIHDLDELAITGGNGTVHAQG
jgi:hypothetical protein